MSPRRGTKSDIACTNARLICCPDWRTQLVAGLRRALATPLNWRGAARQWDKTNPRSGSSSCSTTASIRSVRSRAIIALRTSSAYCSTPNPRVQPVIESVRCHQHWVDSASKQPWERVHAAQKLPLPTVEERIGGNKAADITLCFGQPATGWTVD